LNTKNKITATGALTVPVLRYSFGTINWRSEKITQTRKILTLTKADTDRLHVKKKKRGGRGFLQIEATQNQR